MFINMPILESILILFMCIVNQLVIRARLSHIRLIIMKAFLYQCV